MGRKPYTLMKVQDSNSANPRSPSADLSSALAAIEVQFEERAAKVVQLSDVVASGHYQVDAHVLSDGLIQEHMHAAALHYNVNACPKRENCPA